MKTVGIIGWRGMVGSVLMDRMRAEKDFEHFTPVFFTTSQAGQLGPDVGQGAAPLSDASDIEALKKLDIIVTCQGGGYTTSVHGKLREAGWEGHWIDAASTLRMSKDAAIVLDPVNRAQIDQALSSGVRDFAGGNCTVSLMLMGIHSLFENDLIEWINAATYQAASGAGAANMRELVAQMRYLGETASSLIDDPKSAALELDRTVADAIRSDAYPKAEFGAQLAGSLIPWIDSAVDGGRTKEEWKGLVETNKILGTEANPIPVDGLCVRVGAMRCHSQALTIKLKKAVPLSEIEAMIKGSNPWVKFVENDKASTLAELSPAAVTGKLEIAVGRLHTLAMGPEYLSLFTVGDQLLWGAAEPVRRMLLILLGKL